MKAYILIWLLLLCLCVCSCRTQEWYGKQINIANYKYPGLTSKFCADEFPITSDTIIKYTEKYYPANNISYQDIVDSLQIVALNQIEPLPPNDTCIDKVAPYLVQISKLNQYINRLKYQYKECKPDTVFKYQDRTITKENTARIEALKIENKGNASSLNTWRNVAVISLVLVLVSSLILFFTLKRMK